MNRPGQIKASNIPGAVQSHLESPCADMWGHVGSMWENDLWLLRPTSPGMQKAPQTWGQMQWAILGSNSPLVLRYGQDAWFYWGAVPSDQLRFAQIATKIATKACVKSRR
jgi:hypothetical protein